MKSLAFKEAPSSQSTYRQIIEVKSCSFTNALDFPLSARLYSGVMEPSPQPSFQSRMLGELDEIARTRMPFGRYADWRLHELPAEYLHWFTTKGWPKGRLGTLLQIVYQMKVDGSDIAFDRYRSRKRKGPE